MGEKGEPIVACTTTCKEIEVPTQEEVTALHAMGRIKDRVRGLKTKRSDLISAEQGGQEEIAALDRELGELKEKWNFWEKKRQKAAKERMVLLGHEEPT